MVHISRSQEKCHQILGKAGVYGKNQVSLVSGTWEMRDVHRNNAFNPLYVPGVSSILMLDLRPSAVAGSADNFLEECKRYDDQKN